jgi:hypothetical protein
MARRSDGGIGNRIIVQPVDRATVESPWSLISYPRPDNALAPDESREEALAPERLYWRSSGTLAVAAGHPYYVDEKHLMVTRYELEHPPPPVIPKRRGRPPKVRPVEPEVQEVQLS